MNFWSDPSFYQISGHALLKAFDGIIGLFLGIYVLLKNRRSIVHVSFFFLVLPASIWLPFNALEEIIRIPSLSLPIARGGMTGIILMMPGIYFFTQSILGFFQKKKWNIVLQYALAVVYLILNYTSPMFLAEGHYVFSSGVYAKTGPFYMVFILHLLCILGISIAAYIKAYRQAKIAEEKNRIKYIFIAFAVASSTAIDLLPHYGVPIYPIGGFTILVWIILMTYVVAFCRLSGEKV